MNIWRIHLKAAAQVGVDQRKLCLDKGIVGVGWQVEYDSGPVLWEYYFMAASLKYGARNWKIALTAIKHRIQIDDLIWTRDWNGSYFIGRITSDWYYDTSPECSAADIVNVRSCEWRRVGTDEAVPGKIVSSFRAPRTVQVINDPSSYEFSRVIYNTRSSTNFFLLASVVGQDIFSLLSPNDCEDALAIYLQVRFKYFIIPSSCKFDTMAYEFELKNSESGKSAVAQVKTGWTTLNRDDYQNLEVDIFLFATCGIYYGALKSNIFVISPETIRLFLFEHTILLPEKIKTWVELSRSVN